MAWPTTDDPRTEFVTVRFTANEAADLDWLISQTGAKNRSEAIRTGMDRVVASERRRVKKAKHAAAPGGAVLDGADRTIGQGQGQDAHEQQMNGADS